MRKACNGICEDFTFICNTKNTVVLLNAATIMKSLLVFLALVVSVESSNSDLLNNQETQCSNDNDCPAWFTCNKERKCQCGDRHDGKIACNDKSQRSAVLECNCVTYDERSKSTFLGSCFYNCVSDYGIHQLKAYQWLPERPQKLLNLSTCTSFHRRGKLCGDCDEAQGYSPLVLSYNLSCVKCPDGPKNWWKFILAGFVPLTLFYFFVVIFKINVTSSRLHGVVWFSQAMSSPVFARSILTAFNHSSPASVVAAKAILSFYSVWNLDLFRSIIPNICLNVTTLQALALDYLLAFYPIILAIISIIVLELYDRKVTWIVAIWKPIRNMLSKFRKSWDVRTSIIDSFATFFLLSYMKVLNVTTDLLVPTVIHNLDSSTPKVGLYYSPSVSYFGADHRPYAILAVIMFILFTIVPALILFLYSFRFFHQILSLFPLNWHFLHAFVDSFQGCYKDGTEPGTFDCRWFAAVMLLFRPIFVIIFGLTMSIMFFVYALIALLILVIAVINIQPFKKASVRYPSTDPIFIVFLSLVYVSVLVRATIFDTRSPTLYNVMTVLGLASAIIPSLYITIFIGLWLFSRTKWIINKQ